MSRNFGLDPRTMSRLDDRGIYHPLSPEFSKSRIFSENKVDHRAVAATRDLMLAALICGILAVCFWIGSARADIVSTVGLTQIAPPATVDSNFLINAGLPPQILFAEQQGVTLLAPLVTDTGVVAAGTVVDSWFFAVNVASPETVANTSVTFNGAVLGITYKENLNGLPSANFASSDFLGNPGTTYHESGSGCLFCAFEWLGQTDQTFNIDTASFAGDTASFHNFYSQPGDFARIIVTNPAAVPGPVVGAGLPGLVAAFALLGLARRRKHHAAP